jgi:hypothetical protein
MSSAAEPPITPDPPRPPGAPEAPDIEPAVPDRREAPDPDTDATRDAERGEPPD